MIHETRSIFSSYFKALPSSQLLLHSLSVVFECSLKKLSVPMVLSQVKYAGLDSYAGVLIFYHIWARMDPIFTERRPDVLSLPVNTPLRLYTSTNSRCVAEGTLVDYPQGSTWGSTGLTIGRVTGGATRMVIKLTARHIPGAFTLHPREDGGQVQALDELELGDLVLWNAVSWYCFCGPVSPDLTSKHKTKCRGLSTIRDCGAKGRFAVTHNPNL